MRKIVPDKESIAACGLYCGACRKFLMEKCPGCRQNEKADWCKIRKCVYQRGSRTCAECDKAVTDCKIYSNFISKVFAFIFKSDRPACIRYIKEHGEQAFAEEMAKRECQTMKK